MGVFSLPIHHSMHLVAPAQLYPFGWCVIPAGHFPQESLDRNLKIGFSLSPPPNHALLPLTHDLTASCINWVQASEVWALRVSPSICVQSLPTAHSSAVVWRLACTVYRLFFDILCELLFYFPLPLGAGLVVTGLYISFDPFLNCPHFLPCHFVISVVMT